MTDRKLSIIVAVDEGGGMGIKGKIPWHYPEDFKHFQTKTQGAICIMGRATYEEILEHAKRRWKKDNSNGKKELLPGRECYILSRKKKLKVTGGVTHFGGIREVLDSLKPTERREVFVIGGERLFTEALPDVHKIYMTVIKDKMHKCDRFFDVDYTRRKFRIASGKETDDLYFVNYVRQYI